MFCSAAGFSGDYDPLAMTNDRLLKSVYGKFRDNKSRWENDDNIMKLAENLKGVPVFLSHGGKDYIVPKQQSMILAMRLRQLQKKDPEYVVFYKELKYSVHDWKYWRRVLPETMNFFDKYLEK